MFSFFFFLHKLNVEHSETFYDELCLTNKKIYILASSFGMRIYDRPLAVLLYVPWLHLNKFCIMSRHRDVDNAFAFYKLNSPN